MNYQRLQRDAESEAEEVFRGPGGQPMPMASGAPFRHPGRPEWVAGTHAVHGGPPEHQQEVPCMRWSAVLQISLALLAVVAVAAVAADVVRRGGHWPKLLTNIMASPHVKPENKGAALGLRQALRLTTSADSEPAAAYQAIPSGVCEDYGLLALADMASCRTAAGYLELLESGVPITFDRRRGCHFWGTDNRSPSGHSQHRICIADTAAAATVAAGGSAPTDPGAWRVSADASTDAASSLAAPAANASVPVAASGTSGQATPAPAPELAPAAGPTSPAAPTPAAAPTPTTEPAPREKPTPPPQCGQIEVGYEYPGNDLYTVSTSTAETCCQVCMSDARCLAWTWGKASAKVDTVCHLKGDKPRSWLAKIRNPNSVSGHQLQRNRSIQVRPSKPGQSLFCWSLVLPWGYERSLLACQYAERASIFACNEYAAYSNTSMLVAPAVKTGVVATDLVTKKGGEFGTVLNTDVFLTVWAKVLRDGRYAFHDWTVKVDPDAVFFPSRLRTLLLQHHETHAGTYLNNCKFGMHGPVEVFSRNAVKALGPGSDRCMAHFSRLCSGKCKWGEDMFIDQCLQKVLNASREDEYQVMLEDHCDPPQDWGSCKNSTVAAFHPFKSLDGYRQCLASARK